MECSFADRLRVPVAQAPVRQITSLSLTKGLGPKSGNGSYRSNKGLRLAGIAPARCFSACVWGIGDDRSTSASRADSGAAGFGRARHRACAGGRPHTSRQFLDRRPVAARCARCRRRSATARSRACLDRARTIALPRCEPARRHRPPAARERSRGAGAHRGGPAPARSVAPPRAPAPSATAISPGQRASRRPETMSIVSRVSRPTAMRWVPRSNRSASAGRAGRDQGRDDLGRRQRRLRPHAARRHDRRRQGAGRRIPPQPTAATSAEAAEFFEALAPHRGRGLGSRYRSDRIHAEPRAPAVEPRRIRRGRTPVRRGRGDPRPATPSSSACAAISA